jgi:hypothetical protein
MLSDGSWTRNQHYVGVAVPVPHAVHEDMLLTKQERMNALLNRGGV